MEDFINALLWLHPRGLLALIGEADLPPEDMEEIAAAAGVEPSEILSSWAGVVLAARRYREGKPKKWNQFVAALAAKTDPLTRRSPMSDVAREYGVSARTVRRRLKDVPALIAKEAARGYQENRDHAATPKRAKTATPTRAART